MSLPTHDTIVALSTPRGAGALAVIRLSGPLAWPIAEAITRLLSGKGVADQASHTVHAGRIMVENDVVDHVMVTLMRGPRTFTGQDTVEITCHNNEHIHQAIVTACIRAGARLAQQGEFTRQAYQAGKLDLLQAEAINELIHAQTHQSLKHALAQVSGSLSSEIAHLEAQLIKSLAWCEASFEFLDEGGDFKHELTGQFATLSAKLTVLQNSFEFQNQTRNGYRIALIGTVNAGKSSLFNILLNAKRAIVSPQAGTTRDSIEACVIKDGNTFMLIDTAGLRSTGDAIEAEGIERSYREAKAADALLLVVDSTQLLSGPEQEIYRHILHNYGQKTILVFNKSDVGPALFSLPGAAYTLTTSTTLDAEKHAGALWSLMAAHITDLTHKHQVPFLLNKRHQHALTLLHKEITALIVLLEQENPAYELASYHIRLALENLSELTGKSISESALDTVFKEFCVGK